MLHHFLVSFILLNIRSIYGALCVTKVIVRVPKEHDIGLIFDLTVQNGRSSKRETLQLAITSDGLCTLNTTKGDQFNASSIFGGDFGSIEPGKSVTVSLIWPTVSLYNRVGFCPINITAYNAQKDVATIKQFLHFDTRFETLDPLNHTLRNHRSFVNCNNWDKDYYNNCAPLNCEERYFGQRSFYNFATEQCEPVTPCSDPDGYYDIYANECLDKHNFITDDELEQLRQGKFDENFLELRSIRESRAQFTEPIQNQQSQASPSMQGICNQSNNSIDDKPVNECSSNRPLSLIDFNNCFHHLEEKSSFEQTLEQSSIKSHNVPKRHEKKSALNRFYYDWYLPLRAESDEDDSGSEDEGGNKDENTDKSDEISTSNASTIMEYLRAKTAVAWVIMLFKGMIIMFVVIMFQVAVTLSIYLLICLIISGSIEWVAEMTTYDDAIIHVTKKLTPRGADNHLNVVTKASAMSQR